jgi:hypothetical protein
MTNSSVTLSPAAASGTKPLQAGAGSRPATKWTRLDTHDLTGFLFGLRRAALGCDGTSIPKDGI